MTPNKRSNVTSKQAVGYVRVSTGQQAEQGVSLEAQQERLNVYCMLNALELVHVYREEAVSASIPLADRPAGKELLAAVKAGACHVVTVKLDRLFRSASDALVTTAAWDRRGVALHLIDFGGASLNTATAMGRMILTMMAGFAEFERGLTAERTTSALAFKRDHRQVFNHVPYGFQRDGDKLVVDSAEQAVVAHVRQLRNAGLPLAKIAAHLNVSTPTKKDGCRWYASTVSNILTSTLHGQE